MLKIRKQVNNLAELLHCVLCLNPTKLFACIFYVNKLLRMTEFIQIIL